MLKACEVKNSLCMTSIKCLVFKITNGSRPDAQNQVNNKYDEKAPVIRRVITGADKA